MPSPEQTRFIKAISRYRYPYYHSIPLFYSTHSLSLAKASSTASWSLSFYPQPLLNLRRRATSGTTPSFPAANVVGFTAYLISTASFFSSPLIRAQYAARNPASPEPTVRGNDVAFAAHALLLSVLSCSMYWKGLWGFEQDKPTAGRWRLGKEILGIIAGCMAGVACVMGLVIFGGRNGGQDPDAWAWIDVVYAVGYVKLLITCVKYVPQAVVNYQRKSTLGWSIDQILMDFVGGILSIAQLVLDSSLQNDWSGITGNPVKLWLGNVSIFFDIVFMVQHYILYHSKVKGSVGETGRLLESNDDELDYK